ncbi:MAG: PEP-CTERM sorting domain-containing protein [Chthonomonas sp.]|nr:PEP-CTERM sorting domain-containing protein [Chthonomonas sp.]
MNKATAIFILSAISFGTAAQASVYEMSWNGQNLPNLGINHDAGKIKKMSTVFDSGTNRLKYEVTLGKSSAGLKANGFWLVVSPGANPKGHANELAIFYYDVSGSNPVLTAYNYNGQNGYTSYQTGTKLLSSKNNASSIFSLTNRTEGQDKVLGFDINATAINAHRPASGVQGQWTGAKFGSKMGIWMHPVSGLSTSYNKDGFLKSFNFCKAGWFDGENLKTQVVPEPASAAILAVGGAFLAFRKRK